MKSATTSLCDLLSNHPDIFICTPKEPEFFCRSADPACEINSYADLFSSATAHQIAGEGSTSYTKQLAFPGIAERISGLIPKVKLIYIMRDPIRRIESHWMHTIRSGKQMASHEIISVRPSDNYVDTSLYWGQLSEVWNWFPQQQVLTLFYEDFLRTPNETLGTCHRFLGVPFIAESTAAEARHASIGSVVDKPIIGKFQESNFLRGLSGVLPRSVRNVLKRPFQFEVTSRPTWTEEGLNQVLEVVRPDAERVLAHCGKPADFWPLHADAYLRDR